MPAAARVEDPITHTNAFSGLLAGVVVGAVLGAVIVGSGGTAAPLLIASAACTGGALGGMAGEFLARVAPPSPAGKIVDGSHNVRINSKYAGFCTSPSACDKHSGPVIVAQGSSIVRINGNAAARTGDKGSCGFAVGTGSPNVNIGGTAAACAEVADEVPGWAHTALFVLSLAGPGLALRAGGMAAAAIAARLGLSVLGSEAGGRGMHYLGGKLFGEGSWEQTGMTVVGSVLGGGVGFKAGAAADAVPRLNPLNYTAEPIPGTLGSNLGNVRGRYVGPATEGEGVLARPASPAAPQSIIHAEGRHGDLSGNLEPGVQSHHLNQDAAFGGRIPRDDGAAVGVRGNAFTEPGTAHYEAHRSMEQFWTQYRRGGPLYGEVPTNGEYSNALEQSLREAGASDAEVARLLEAARANREAYGLTDADQVPRIPGRMNQRRP